MKHNFFDAVKKVFLRKMMNSSPVRMAGRTRSNLAQKPATGLHWKTRQKFLRRQSLATLAL
jgi:hypothetical protein